MLLLLSFGVALSGVKAFLRLPIRSFVRTLSYASADAVNLGSSEKLPIHDCNKVAAHALELIKRICDGLNPPSHQTNRSSLDPNFLIIDNPAITMRHDYLGVDIEENAKRILAEQSTPSCRSKPLFAMVAGMGKGKTRFCVELDLALKKRSDVVSIPISFNGHWSEVFRYFNNDNLDYAVSIVVRMMCLHYRIDYIGDAIVRARDVLLPYKKELVAQSAFPAALIRATVQHIVQQLCADGRNINHFVMIVDDANKVEEVFDGRRYGRIQETLEICLLNDYINISNKQDGPLFVNLVMTSMNLKAIGVRNSGRYIIALTLPPSLDAELVLQSWIKLYNPAVADLSEAAQTRLRILIAMFGATPRALEVISVYLTGRLKAAGDSVADLEAASLAQLFSDVQRAVEVRNMDHRLRTEMDNLIKMLPKTDAETADIVAKGADDPRMREVRSAVQSYIALVEEVTAGRDSTGGGVGRGVRAQGTDDGDDK